MPESVSGGVDGESAQKLANKAEQNKSREDAQPPAYGSEEYKAREAAREAKQESIRRFGWEVCAPLFAAYIPLPTALMEVVLHQLSSEALPDEVDEEQELKGKALLAWQQQKFGYRLLFGAMDWETKSKLRDHKTPVQIIAKWAQGTLTTWGVKSPKTLLETAQEYEVVATETEE